MALSTDFKLLGRSWRQHLGMQMATLVVLASTLSVVVFVLAISINLQRILTVWGERVQISAYLEDNISQRNLEMLIADIKALPQIADVQYVTKKMAADQFREQMASYAPDLLDDSEYATPFPANLKIRLKDGTQSETYVQDLEGLAQLIGKKDGVEDVSYGQSWVKNFATFVSALRASGLLLGLILLVGSVLVIGNAIRTSISSRKQEIEIMELVGATASMIRRPFMVEGAAMGLLASVIALGVNALVLSWIFGLMKARIKKLENGKEEKSGAVDYDKGYEDASQEEIDFLTDFMELMSKMEMMGVLFEKIAQGLVGNSTPSGSEHKYSEDKEASAPSISKSSPGTGKDTMPG